VSRHPTLGVLGGMGPLATVDFLRKLVEATPAPTDQDHIPLVVRFCPEVPDRVDALLRGGPSPEPALVAAARGLEHAGARAIAMPCNTAHAWADAIAAAVQIPLLHIVDASLAAAARHGAPGAMGILATQGTLASGIYRRRGGSHLGWMEPTDVEMRTLVTPGIQAVKANRLDDAARHLGDAALALARRGAGVILMACTEVPLALAGSDLGVPLVDSTAALAQACVAWAIGEQSRPLHP
jgi:aspartate racemase